MRHAVLTGVIGALLLTACGPEGVIDPLPGNLPDPTSSVTLPPIPTFSADTIGVLQLGGVNPHPTFSGLEIRDSDGAFTVGGAALWPPTGRPTLGTVLAFAPDLTLLETLELAPPPRPSATLLVTQHAWASDGTLVVPLSNQFSVGVRAPNGTVTFENSPLNAGGTAPFCNPVHMVNLPGGGHVTLDFCNKDYYERASDGTYTLFADLPLSSTDNGLRFVALDDHRLLVTDRTALYTLDRGDTSPTEVLDLSAAGFPNWGQLRIAPGDGPIWSEGDIIYPTGSGLLVAAGDFSGFELHEAGFTRALNADFDAAGDLYLQDVSTDHLIRIGALGTDALLDSLREAIEALRDGGVLNNGQANALLSKLDNAEMKLDQDEPGPAVNMLNALINQVQALVNGGILTPAQGEHLIELTQRLIGTI